MILFEQNEKIVTPMHKNVHFTFNRDIYIQLNGVAMG